MTMLKNIQKPYVTFLGVEINLHGGVTTGVKNLTSVNLQDGHGSGSAEEMTESSNQKSADSPSRRHRWLLGFGTYCSKLLV